MAIPEWSIIPNSVIEQDRLRQEADRWASDQRTIQAEAWASQQREQLAALRQQAERWQAQQQIARQRTLDAETEANAPTSRIAVQRAEDAWIQRQRDAAYVDPNQNIALRMLGALQGEAENIAHPFQGLITPQGMFDLQGQDRGRGAVDVRGEAQKSYEAAGGGIGGVQEYWKTLGAGYRANTPEGERWKGELTDPAMLVGPGEALGLSKSLLAGARGIVPEARAVAKVAPELVGRVAREVAEQGPDVVQWAATHGPASPQLGIIPDIGRKVKPTSANAATQKLFDMYYGDKPAQIGRTPKEKLSDFGTWMTKHFTDRNVEVSRFVQMAEKAKGGALTADEMTDVLMRLNPDKAAEVHIQEGLKPAVQGAGDDLPFLSAYLTHQNNVDVAKATGGKVANRLFNSDAIRGKLETLKDERILTDWDALNTRYDDVMKQLQDVEEKLGVAETEVMSLNVPSDIIRPRGMFVGWTDDEIRAFAAQEGRNPSIVDWADSLDSVALKDAGSSRRGGNKEVVAREARGKVRDLRVQYRTLTKEQTAIEKQLTKRLSVLSPEDAKEARDQIMMKVGKESADAEQNRAFSGGLRVADSNQALADMPTEMGAERYANVEQQAQRVYDTVDKMRQRLVDSGVWSQEFADEMRQQYPHYVPTKILDYMNETTTGMGAGKGLSLRDRGLRQLTIEGTEKAREDPLASVVRMAYQTEQMARKNDVFNSFVKLRDHLAASDPTWTDRIKEVGSDYVTKKNGPDAEHIIQGYVDGKKVNYSVPKELGLAYEAKGKAIPALSQAMTLFKMGATSRNPLFLSSNAVMDAMTFIARESIRGGGPQSLPKVVKALGEGYIDAFKGLPTGEYRGKTAEFLKGGGGMFGFFQAKPEETAKAVQYMRQHNALDIKSKDDLLHALKQIATLAPVETIGERIELAPRVAAYKLAQKAGKTDQLAVDAGRSVTMDFARGGTVSKFIDQFIPFFNVGIQSPAQVVRAWKENPKGFIGTAATLLTVPTVAAEAWNRSDEQRAKDYADIPQYVKDQGIIIMLPVEAPIDTNGNRRPQFVFLRTREYTPFVTLTREAVSRVMGDNPRDWNDLLGNGVMASVSPVSGSSGSEIVSGLQSPGLGTATQLVTNRDMFRDKYIASDYADENASALSKGVAGLTGARPSQVEFAIRDIGSGVAGIGLAASDVVTGNAKAGTTPQNAPGAGGLVGRFVRGDIGGTLDKAQGQTMSENTKRFLAQNGVDMTIGAVGRTIQGVPLTMSEQAKYQELANKYIDEAIAGLAKHPDWPKVPEKNREKAIRQFVSDARDKAAGEVARSIGLDEAKRRKAAGSAGTSGTSGTQQSPPTNPR